MLQGQSRWEKRAPGGGTNVLQVRSLDRSRPTKQKLKQSVLSWQSRTQERGGWRGNRTRSWRASQQKVCKGIWTLFWRKREVTQVLSARNCLTGFSIIKTSLILVLLSVFILHFLWVYKGVLFCFFFPKHLKCLIILFSYSLIYFFSNVYL